MYLLYNTQVYAGVHVRARSHSTENGTECVPCSMTSRPDATEFGDFIWKFKNTNPSTACSSGGHAAFGDAVKLTEDNKTVISESCD